MALYVGEEGDIVCSRAHPSDLVSSSFIRSVTPREWLWISRFFLDGDKSWITVPDWAVIWKVTRIKLANQGMQAKWKITDR